MRYNISILAIIFSMLWFKSSISQNTDRWTAGSSKLLKGEIITLIYFISDENNQWSNLEKDEAVKNVKNAQDWITRQAAFWNIRINFSDIIINNNKDIVFSQIEPGMAKGTERVDWIFQTIKKSGYKNSKQAYRKLSRKYNCKNINIILLAKAKGRSYSMRYARGMNKKKYMLEGMIIYNTYSNSSTSPMAATIAHEMLHLYGAWDLYLTYAQTRDRQELAFELYPNDIMLRLEHNLSNLNIDKLTAWLIGWNKTEEGHFEWFRPADFNK